MKILAVLALGLVLLFASCKSNDQVPSVTKKETGAAQATKPVLDQVPAYQTNPEFQPLCLNSGKSTTGIVYLHGMDIASVSGQERANREKLMRIAEKLNIVVALPRASGICPTNSGQICWGWKYSRDELELIKERILSSAQTCGLQHVFALVGFSNGGYAVNALHSECMADRFGRLISIGAMLNTSAIRLKYNQGCAGQMFRLIGQQDNFNSNPAALKYVTDNKLENLIQVTEFDGGHEVPEALLQVVLQNRLKQLN